MFVSVHFLELLERGYVIDCITRSYRLFIVIIVIDSNIECFENNKKT